MYRLTIKAEAQRAKLTDAQVRNVRDARVRFGWSYSALGKFFGVSPWTVRDIVTYRTRVSAGKVADE